MHKSTQLGVRVIGFASAPGPSFSLRHLIASSSACSTLQRTRTSEIYSQVLRSEARAQCFVRVGDGLSTTCLKSDHATSGTGLGRIRAHERGEQGCKATYRDVSSPFLAHEVGERAGKQVEFAKLPHTQLHLTKTQSGRLQRTHTNTRVANNAPDDESPKKAGRSRPITVAVDSGVLKELDNVRVHLADDENLHIEQLLQTIMGKVGRERAVAHAHV
jgi:hypothetical protein